VIRPSATIVIAPRARSRLFARVPLWLELQVGKDVVHSFPAVSLTSTWIGATPREGTLGYALHDPTPHEPPKTPPSRAILPITVINRDDENLELERLIVVVPEMAVYRDQASTLWTDGATIAFDNDGQAVPARVEGAPPEASNAMRLSPPRQRSGTNLGWMVGRVMRGGGG
jgi:hypothetical protein